MRGTAELMCDSAGVSKGNREGKFGSNIFFNDRPDTHNLQIEDAASQPAPSLRVDVSPSVLSAARTYLKPLAGAELRGAPQPSE